MQALEFQARQRMWALEQDNHRAAVASKVRDELAVQSSEVEARKRAKEREWEAGASRGASLPACHSVRCFGGSLHENQLACGSRFVTRVWY